MGVLKNHRTLYIFERRIYGAPEEIQKLPIDGYLLMEVAGRHAYTAADVAAMLEDPTMKRHVLRVTVEVIED